VNERRFFDELAGLMEEGVLVDHSELVPEEAEDCLSVGFSVQGLLW
jgi:hypothetical protein